MEPVFFTAALTPAKIGSSSTALDVKLPGITTYDDVLYSENYVTDLKTKENNTKAISEQTNASRV